MNKIYSIESKGALYLSGFSEAADNQLIEENNILRVLRYFVLNN